MNTFPLPCFVLHLLPANTSPTAPRPPTAPLPPPDALFPCPGSPSPWPLLSPSQVDYGNEFFMVNRAFKAIRRADVVLLLVDVEAGITDQVIIDRDALELLLVSQGFVCVIFFSDARAYCSDKWHADCSCGNYCVCGHVTYSSIVNRVAMYCKSLVTERRCVRVLEIKDSGTFVRWATAFRFSSLACFFAGSMMMDGGTLPSRMF